MNIKDIDKIMEEQHKYYASGATLPISFRINALKKLKKTMKKYESRIVDALIKDLGKCEMEGFMCETGLVYEEINYMIKNTAKFAADKTVPTPLAQFASHSFQKHSPKGVCLIMSPWNYPILLTIDPLVDAIAAGNTAVLKPSAYSPATSAIIDKIVSEAFPPKYVAVVTGGRKENAALLDQAFDFIFFTGSQAVGKEVLRHAAERLTPCALELGGKSPCVIDKTANIKLAARRVAWGKTTNCGQTCVEPDYFLCHKDIKDEFIEALKKELKRQVGAHPLKNPDYVHMINQKAFDRVTRLIDSKKVVYGGNYDAKSLRIEPTIMDNITADDLIMGEEIFGPLVPILTYENEDDIIYGLYGKNKPLAFYVYTEDKKLAEKLISRVQFGGGCINDCLIHLATSEMGFGGVGASGMGSYHGKIGFDAFSHVKSIVDKKTWIDLPVRYQPYNKLKRFLLGLFEG